MKNLIALLISLVSINSFAQQVQVSASASAVITSAGYNIDGYASASDVDAVKLDTDGRRALIKQFGITNTEKAVVVGLKYTLSDTAGGSEEGYVWVSVVKDPNPEKIMAAVKSMGNEALNAPMQAYMQKAKANMTANAAKSGKRVTVSSGTQSSEANKPAVKKYQNLEVVAIGADWCGVCVKLKRIIANIKDRYPNVKFTYYDQEKRTDMVKKYNARTTPTVVIMNGDQEVEHMDGSPGESLSQQLDYYLEMTEE